MMVMVGKGEGGGMGMGMGMGKGEGRAKRKFDFDEGSDGGDGGDEGDEVGCDGGGSGGVGGGVGVTGGCGRDGCVRKTLRKDGEGKGRGRGRWKGNGKGRGKRKEKDEDEDEDDDEDGYYDDPGREESKEFLELDNLEKRKKKNAERAKALFMEKFVGAVKRDAEGVRNWVEEEEKDFSVQNEEFLKVFKASWTLLAPFQVPKLNPKHPEDCRSFAPLMYVKSQDLIGKAMEIVSQFEKLAEKDVKKELAGLFRNEWNKKDEEMAKMLELGKMVGLNKFECVMHASKPDPVKAAAVGVSEKLFPVVHEEGGAIGWGMEAKKQERANRKLLKTFEGWA
ncbi:hypothetical protein DSL72_002962 [Monilinia vaccinii-corymbosi]|uniref:Uncharacterized protein n=1 Tax=Monilinia vaccinii-corymbosi TaxID=61207 RepID=A0A8A3PE80_9HELO|nr:hypothetical protein DSL72_002962 [Monilinia vaccinii-corymbosi]